MISSNKEDMKDFNFKKPLNPGNLRKIDILPKLFFHRVCIK